MIDTFRINGRSFRAGRPPRYEKFWGLVEQNRWEPATFQALETYLPAGGSYVDAGAWIGPTLLYAAGIAGRCTAFEPDPAAFAELRKNLELNPELASRCTLRNSALTDHAGYISLTPPGEAGKSETSSLEPEAENTFRAKAVDAAAAFANELADTDFLKMDIEGGEYATIPAMRGFLSTKRPVVLLSLHPQMLAKAGCDPERESMRLLSAFIGYTRLYSVGRDSLTEARDIRVGEQAGFASVPQGTLLFLP
ncbi:FkbM family methyltransferase [Desulfovibrio oxyclinae]|uniref:FkbM family methyltransferase n=1 Tax=Desulfovibrio oxyclinae TaxID=63560 RepID=UPI000361B9F5|nr:FkbM family methyltransferase [Desulfovibrio oxyclinae]